ncbi:MAG: hypothetical protein ACE5EA_03500 [Nitrospirota bacterium]
MITDEKFKPFCMATGIGSLPHKDPELASELVIQNTPYIPFWPQLTKRGIKEGMAGQYSEAMPGITFDEKKERFYFDTSGDITGRLERFFERFLENDFSYFGISREYAVGFYAMKERLNRDRPENMIGIKGQITGPITYSMMLKDETGKDIIHNEMLYDAIVKGLSMKACWQIDQLREFGLPIIISIDEPGLVSVGSAYSTLSRDEIIRVWNEVIEHITQEGGIAAIHCCGNTDWSLLFDSKCNIINFDSYGFMDKMALYPDGLKSFLSRGGILGWGAIPTSDNINNESIDGLMSRIDDAVALLVSKGIEKEMLLSQSLITPSCGMGSLSIEQAVKVMELTSGLSSEMRKRYF